MSGIDKLARDVKRRLAPWLNEPYFEVRSKMDAMVANACTHENHGVTLDEVDRTCTCRGCGKPVDPFEALLHYAASERRLVYQAESIKEARVAEARKKALAQERRTFARAVVGRRPRIESQEGIDVVVGHELTLECGHVLDWSRPTSPHRATCHQCREAAQ